MKSIRRRCLLTSGLVLALGFAMSAGGALAHNTDETELMTTFEMPAWPDAPAIFALAKITIEPGVVDPVDPDNPKTSWTTNFINAGVMDFLCQIDLTAHVTGETEPFTFKANEPFQLTIGDAVMLPPGAGCEVGNSGDEPVEVYVTMLDHYTEPTGTPTPTIEGETVEVLAASILTTMPEKAGVMNNWLYRFAPTDSVAADPTNNVASTIYVGYGMLDIQCGVDIEIHHAGIEGFETIPANTPYQMQLGDATVILPGAACALANSTTEEAVILATSIGETTA